MQALPGSRLDTALLKDWLMQHMYSLHVYQSQVAAAESVSRQKQHASAAAAAVKAVQLAMVPEEEEDELHESHEAQTADNASAMLGDQLSRLAEEQAAKLPAQVVSAASNAAAEVAVSRDLRHDYQVGYMPRYYGTGIPLAHASHFGCSIRIECCLWQPCTQTCLHMATGHSTQSVSHALTMLRLCSPRAVLFSFCRMQDTGHSSKVQPACLMLCPCCAHAVPMLCCLDIEDTGHAQQHSVNHNLAKSQWGSPHGVKTLQGLHKALALAKGAPEACQMGEQGSILGFVRAPAVDQQGFASREVVQKQMQIMSACFEGLCHGVRCCTGCNVDAAPAFIMTQPIVFLDLNLHAAICSHLSCEAYPLYITPFTPCLCTHCT